MDDCFHTLRKETEDPHEGLTRCSNSWGSKVIDLQGPWPKCGE